MFSVQRYPGTANPAPRAICTNTHRKSAAARCLSNSNQIGGALYENELVLSITVRHVTNASEVESFLVKITALRFFQ